MFQVGTLLPNGKAKNTWFKNKDEAITCRRNYEEQWAFNDLEGELWVDVEETHDKAVSNFGRVKSTEFMIHKLLSQTPSVQGYPRTSLKGKGRITTHILVFKAFKGDIPSGMHVDHIDQDKTNNHIDNLRLATPSQNAMNKSSSQGVTFDKSRNKCAASIKKDSKTFHLGRFDTKEEALASRRAGELKYFDAFAPDRDLHL
jgi:hypothetical protein